MADEINPYQPPTSPLIDGPSGRRRSWVRLVAAAACWFLGGGGVIGGVLETASLVTPIGGFGWWRVPELRMCLGLSVMTGGSVMMFVAGFDWLHERWSRAVLLSIVSIAIMKGGGAIIKVSRPIPRAVSLSTARLIARPEGLPRGRSA